MKLIITIFSLFSFISCNQAQNQTKEAKKNSPQKVKKNMNANLEVATFGGGCYWCIEAIFQRLEGVEKVESGFSGGQVKNPTYREVCTGATGHAEVIQITFDTTKISFEEILKVFFTMHDPTTLNQQGNDIGTQYRSSIFYHNEAQKKVSEEIITALNQAKAYPSTIVTEVTPFDVFYKAEDYHQNYYNDNSGEGYCRYVIQPKIEKFEKVFKDRLKK
ncbi:MAG: peptide-methionine (S)-S-oxide reductase MsrA [Chitinophagales bacterium]|nr:peptide-methionine (S)-S-oxide reductase MsrA [Chitinophagales bacterium]